MVNIKNKNKVIVNVNNVQKVQKKRRNRNGLRLSQDRIVKHYHYNTPQFTPINQTIQKSVIDTEKEKRERDKLQN